jgi:hypothetical protein
LRVLFLQGVEEDDVEGFTGEAREDFERKAALDAHALAESRAADVLAAARNHLLARLDGDHFPALGQPAREVYDGVADGHADFQHAPGACRARGDFEEPRHLAVGDGDAVLLRVSLHLGQQPRVRGQEAFEVLGLLRPHNSVETRFHFLDSAFEI